MRIGVVPACNFQALHFGLQRGAFQSQTLGGAFRAGENSMYFSQDSDNVPPLGLIKVMLCAIGLAGRSA